MNKKNATLVFLAMIIFPILGWIKLFSGQSENTKAYEENIRLAKMFEEKEIYVDALEYYKQAYKMNSKNTDLLIKQAEMYGNLGDSMGLVKTCDQVIESAPKNPQPYILKTKHYLDKRDYKNAIKTIKAAKKAVKNNEEIDALEKELSKKTVEKYSPFTDVSDWHVQKGESIVGVEEHGKWGLSLRDGTRKLKASFEYIGAYDEETGTIPCCQDGIYFYVDIKGNKKLVTDTEYQYLGTFGSNYAPALKDKVYGYITNKLEEEHFEYEYAGAFANDVAAVKKGGKWALIDSKFKNITGFDYDEIKLDKNGFCSHYNIIVARQGDKYLFIDRDGKEVGSERFADAKMAASDDQPIAIKQGNKWGYADQKGNIVISPSYENANSFSMGLAAVAKDGQWGFIDLDQELIVDYKYSDAGVFSKDGAAPIRGLASWNFLVLCEYER